MATKFETAIRNLNAAITAAHELIQQSRAKVAEQFKVAINRAIDAGRASKLEPGEIRDAIVGLFDKAVEDGRIEKATARAYMTGLRFALERGVLWNPGLHSTEGQIQALQDAGKKIPKELADKAEKAAAKREAKNGKASVASDDSVVKHLAKALVDARALGRAYAADILDVIHSIRPEWKEPTAE